MVCLVRKHTQETLERANTGLVICPRESGDIVQGEMFSEVLYPRRRGLDI
jgi:hypothetical protein